MRIEDREHQEQLLGSVASLSWTLGLEFECQCLCISASSCVPLPSLRFASPWAQGSWMSY